MSRTRKGMRKSVEAPEGGLAQDGNQAPEKGTSDETESRYDEILGYYKRIKSAILEGDLLESMENCETLVERMVEDMRRKDLETLFLTDQRCSKIFELVLSIGMLCVRRLFDEILKSEENNSLSLERLSSSLNRSVFILESVFREVERNVFSMYGSHVTETALESGMLLQDYVGRMAESKELSDIREVLLDERRKILEAIAASIKRLGEGPGWVSVLTDPSATHVGRAMINVCIGKISITMENIEEYIIESVGRRNQGSKNQKLNGNKKTQNQGFECHRVGKLQELLFTLRKEEGEEANSDADCSISGNTISSQIYEALKLDLEGILCDTYGLPCLVTLIRALNEVGRREGRHLSILGKIFTLVITNGQETEEDFLSKAVTKQKIDTDRISRLFMNCTNEWINSSLKSRLLEVVLEIMPYSLMTIWISSHTRLLDQTNAYLADSSDCGESLVNRMLDSEYGHFVILNLLRSGVLRREEFILIVKSLEFSKLIQRKESIDVLIALIDTCRRLQCEYKYLTARLWKSLEIETSEDYQYTFSCLIFMVKRSVFGVSRPNSRDGIQKKVFENDKVTKGKGNSGKESNVDKINDDFGEEGIPSEIKNEESHNFKVFPQGCAIIGSLSKFPVETIHPMVSGITYFISRFKDKIKGEIVETSYGTKMIEDILSRSSTIPASIKKKWIQSYIGNFLDLVLKGGVCNYALIAMFHASDQFYRKIIVEELLNEQNGGGKDVLMSKNFKIFKSLKIESFLKMNNKDWYNVNNKIDKTREMFSSIIEEKINDTDEVYNDVNTKVTIKRKCDINDSNNDKDFAEDKSMNSILQHIRKKNVNKRTRN